MQEVLFDWPEEEGMELNMTGTKGYATDECTYICGELEIVYPVTSISSGRAQSYVPRL